MIVHPHAAGYERRNIASVDFYEIGPTILSGDHNSGFSTCATHLLCFTGSDKCSGNILLTNTGNCKIQVIKFGKEKGTKKWQQEAHGVQT
jgi:hypothetical protein